MLAARRIKFQAEKARQAILAIGKELTEVKQRLPHGQFGDWLSQEFSMSDRMARHLMQVYEVYGTKSETVSVLSDSALILLAGPSVPEAARQQAAEEAQATGKSPTKRCTQEIIDQHKAAPRPRALTLDETIALVWRTLDNHSGPEPARRLAWLQTATAADFQAALKPNRTLDAAQLAYARQIVTRELQDQLNRAPRTAQSQSPAATAQNGLNATQQNTPTSPPTQPTTPPVPASEPASLSPAQLLAIWQTAQQTLDMLDKRFYHPAPAFVQEWIAHTIQMLQEHMTDDR